MPTDPVNLTIRTAPAVDPVAIAAAAVRAAEAQLQRDAVAAVRDRGLSEVAVAQLAGVHRTTLRRWLGKP